MATGFVELLANGHDSVQATVVHDRQVLDSVEPDCDRRFPDPGGAVDA
jgi:hypothetical protein